MDETREIPSQRTQQLPRTVVVRSTRRIAVAVLGSFLILAGLAAIFLPGPWTILGILGGVTVLSWEFQWAKRLRFDLKRRWNRIKARRKK